MLITLDKGEGACSKRKSLMLVMFSGKRSSPQEGIQDILDKIKNQVDLLRNVLDMFLIDSLLILIHLQSINYLFFELVLFCLLDKLQMDKIKTNNIVFATFKKA